MTTLSFDFADTFEIESRDTSVTASTSKFTAEIASKIFGYGLNAVISDAANGAPRAAAVVAIGEKGDKEKPEAYEKRLREWTKNEANKPAIAAKTEELMAARLANLEAGTWSVRGTGGMSRTERIRDTIVRASAKALLGEAWSKFEALDDAAQTAKVAEWYAGNQEAFDAAVAKRIAELDAAKAERNSLRNAVSISL